jgi:hypothetical protein
MDKPITIGKFSGLNSGNPERLSEGDLIEALNVDVDDTGQVSRRPGFASVRAGAAHSLWSKGALALFVSGTTLYRLNEDYSAVAVTTVTANMPVSYAEVAGRVYWSNGIETGIYDGGHRTWGLAVPALPGVEVIGGSLPAGTYLYTMTLRRNDGQESGAPAAGRIDLTEAGGLRFSFPASADPTVVGATIYLSQQNGDVLYRAVSTTGTSVDYVGGLVNLVTPLDTLLLGPAPAGQIVARFSGRLYVALGSALFCSEPFGHELFDLREHITVDTTEITLVAPVTDGIFVGTRERVVFLAGQGPDSFVMQTKAECGAIPGTLAYVDQDAAKFEIAGKLVALFATERGLLAAADGGVTFDLTQSKYVMPRYHRGAGLYRSDGGSYRYVAILQS